MPKPRLKIEMILPGEWRFVYRAEETKHIDNLLEGQSLVENGQFEEGEKIIRGIINDCPIHIHARHLLAFLLLRRNEPALALEAWREAVILGKSAFPKKFFIGKDRLEWMWPENRPFLRAVAGLGMALSEVHKLDEATVVFNEYLSFDPWDHLGVRAKLIEIAFAQGRPEEVTKICNIYSSDFLVDTLFARPLALIMLGKIDEAVIHLRQAIEEYPLVGRELLKKRRVRPKTLDPEYIEVGGADEAYHYGRRMGKYWKVTENALEILRAEVGAMKITRTPKKAKALNRS